MEERLTTGSDGDGPVLRRIGRAFSFAAAYLAGISFAVLLRHMHAWLDKSLEAEIAVSAAVSMGAWLLVKGVETTLVWAILKVEEEAAWRRHPRSRIRPLASRR